MKISIITVCRNANAVIEECLKSVAEQTYAQIEHVLVDGLSDDDTVAVARRFPHLAQLVSERDSGLYDAMNKGMKLVTGDFVLFLNADDRLASKNAIAHAVKAIGKAPGGDVYYGSLEVRPLQNEPYVFRPPMPDKAPELMIYGCLPHQSTLARPNVFQKTGPFDLRYRYHADYDWFLKVLADPSIDVRAIGVIIGSFQEGGTSSQLAKGQPECFEIQNSSRLFASPQWDKRRIRVLQEALLRERIAVVQLGKKLREGPDWLGGRRVIRFARRVKGKARRIVNLLVDRMRAQRGRP